MIPSKVKYSACFDIAYKISRDRYLQSIYFLEYKLYQQTNHRGTLIRIQRTCPPMVWTNTSQKRCHPNKRVCIVSKYRKVPFLCGYFGYSFDFLSFANSIASYLLFSGFLTVKIFSHGLNGGLNVSRVTGKRLVMMMNCCVRTVFKVGQKYQTAFRLIQVLQLNNLKFSEINL